MNTTQTFTILDIVAAVFKSPIKFILWFLAFFSLVILAYLVVPREYGSDGKLFVQVGRSSVGAAPTTSTGYVSLQGSRETEIKTVVVLLNSRELADRVVGDVGVERILEPNSLIGKFMNNLPSMSRGGGKTIEDGETEWTSDDIDSLNRRNEAITQLMKSLDVRHEKNTTVVSIAVNAQTPFLARDIVSAYLEQYKKKHVEVHTPQASGFFNEQLQIRKEALLVAEKKLEQFRSGFDVLDIGSARSLLQRELDQLKLDALDTSVKLSEAREKASQITTAYADVPEFIVGADKQTSSLARDKAREALYNLQLQESEMTSRYKEGNPKLSAIRETVTSAEKQLSKIPQSFKEAQRSVNPAHKEVFVMLTKALADANGFEKRLEATNALIASKVLEVGKLNQMARTESQLYLDVEIQKKTMLGIADKSAESVTIDALDNESISNVNIAQEASLVPKKMFPSGKMFVIFGGALSALLATMMTFLKQYKIVYESGRQKRRRQNEQVQSNSDQTRPSRPRRVARTAALVTSGASSDIDDDDFQPAETSTDELPDERPSEDEEYSESTYRGQRPLHQELQEEAGTSVPADSIRLTRSIILQRRSENQVSFLMLLGGFGIFLLVYCFFFLLR